MRFLRFLALAGLLVPLSAYSQPPETLTALMVELADGEVHCYKSDCRPSVSFTSEGLVISSDGISAEYPKGKFSRIYFEPVKVVGVEETAVENAVPALTVRYVGPYVIEVSSSEAGDARLYRLDGQCAASVPMADGCAILDLSGLAAGVYIINLNHQSIKIIKK